MKRVSKMINGRSISSKRRHAAAAAEQAEAEKITTQGVKFASLHVENEEDDDDDEAVHGLRQNPRKILRVPVSKNVVNNPQQRFVCNKCGKSFQSSKAMCGHMACHSEKERPSSNVVAKKKPVMKDSESDSEYGAGQMRRRSRRTRYKKHDYVADSKAKLDVVKNCLSESSGIEQEQEEVAICLMMLSRDSANWGGLNSIGDSSDNNSVVLEDRSISARFVVKDGLNSVNGLNEIKEKFRRKNIESLGGYFDSGNVRNGVKNVETDVKITGLGKNKMEEDSKFEPHLSLKKLRSLMDGEGYSQIQRPNMEPYPGKGNGVLNEAYRAGMCNRVEQKVFIHSRSHQSFDVNVASNRQFTAASPYEISHNSFETNAHCSQCKGKGILDDNSGNVGDDYWKKGKYESNAHCNPRKGKGILDDNSGNVGDDYWKKGKYESPMCSKDFGSGHKLGCHQRMHLAEGSEDNKCDEVPANIKQNGIQSHVFIDLNLPAPMEDEEANESMGSY